MSEELQGEQDIPAQEETVPESQEQTTETPPEPETDGEGRLGELQKELENLKTVYGKHTEEVAQLRNENAYWRSQQQQKPQPSGFQQPQQHPQAQTQQPAGSVEEEYDWTDPKSVQRMIDSRVAQVEQRWAQSEQQKRVEQAQGAFRRGTSVLERDKEAFKGIEQEVTQMVQGMYGMNPNMPTTFLEDPSSWYAVADVIRGRQQRMGGKPSNINPVAATQTETPTSVRQREPDKGAKVDLDDGGKGLKAAFKLDNEGVNSILDEAQKEREWRNS